VPVRDFLTRVQVTFPIGLAGDAGFGLVHSLATREDYPYRPDQSQSQRCGASRRLMSRTDAKSAD
jgi:hypothetical protein